MQFYINFLPYTDFEDAEDEVKAEEGGYATFKCVVKSQYRNPKIVWRKNDLVVSKILSKIVFSKLNQNKKIKTFLNFKI